MHLFEKDNKGYQDFDVYENSESKSEGDAEFKFENPYGDEAPGG